MSERTSKKPGIADYVAARRKHKDCFLDEIDRLDQQSPLLQVRLRNFTLEPIDPMGTSPIPSWLEVSPPGWTTPEFTPPPWTLP